MAVRAGGRGAEPAPVHVLVVLPARRECVGTGTSPSATAPAANAAGFVDVPGAAHARAGVAGPV